jgi:hypothetical protein
VHKLSASATSGNLEAVYRNTLLPLRRDTNRKTNDLMAYAKSQSDRANGNIMNGNIMSI